MKSPFGMDGPFSGANLPLVSGRVVVQARAAKTFFWSLELRSKQLKSSTFSGRDLRFVDSWWTYWIGHGHWIRLVWVSLLFVSGYNSLLVTLVGLNKHIWQWLGCNWWRKSRRATDDENQKKIKHRCSIFFSKSSGFYQLRSLALTMLTEPDSLNFRYLVLYLWVTWENSFIDLRMISFPSSGE